MLTKFQRLVNEANASSPPFDYQASEGSEGEDEDEVLIAHSGKI